MNDGTMAVGVYVRVSTEEQRERQSIATQRDFPSGTSHCTGRSPASSTPMMVSPAPSRWRAAPQGAACSATPVSRSSIRS
jgi:hypothetical protein